jgi:epoxyqueuosine reductase QueG
MDRVLTEKVRAEILNFGMDLVGFAPVSRWEKAPYLLSPQAILPESKTVIVGAIHITDTWTEMGGEPEPQDVSPGGWKDQNSLMDRTAYRIVRMLNDNGYQAIAVASSNIWRYRQFEGIPSLFAPDLSHIHAATAAGLAEIGWSGLAITPEFGSRCRFISIVTDAELTPTPMYDGPKLCDMCGDCITCCPSLAMNKDLNSQKPHVVEIGGKTFKYANKNIWRCAWAEHFNLDLNSNTLKDLDHIDEKVILKEIDDKGRRGHERGVCQKVCVPPHLRTDKPSFGRPEKKIAQNRINQRYPDSMPTLRKMRDDIAAKAVHFGVDLVNVAPLQIETEMGKEALKEAPGVKTVIALAIHTPPEYAVGKLIQESEEIYGFTLREKMHHALLRLSRMIEDYGYSAAAYPSSERAEVLAGMTALGDLSDGKFITPEYGINQIIGAITTNAPIDSTPQSRPGKVSKTRKLSGKKLRSKLENLAEHNLVSMFGVAGANTFEPIIDDLKINIDENELGWNIIDIQGGPHGKFIPEITREDIKLRKPEDYVKNAKSVIVLGMHFPDELIRNAGLEKSMQIGCYGFHQYRTTYELQVAAMELATLLSDMGYKTMVTDNMLGIGSRVDTPRGKHPDARCGAIEAVAAGLGEIGKSGALLTKEHGPHQRCIVIVTDAELPTDTIAKPEQYCKDCEICAETCPMQALNDGSFKIRIGETEIDYPQIPRHRCDWSKRYSLCSDEGPALIGNNTKVEAPEGKISIELLANACKQKDPIMKSRTCVLETCLRQCPAG